MFSTYRASVLTAALALSGAGPALAATSGVYLLGQPGTIVGGNQQYSYPGEAITATALEPGKIRVEFDTWRAEFAMPSDGVFAPGSYEFAQRHPFKGSLNPGLTVVHDLLGCNQVFGWFRVHEVQVVGTVVSQLAVDFLHSCEGAPPLYGAIRLNSDHAVIREAPYARALTPIRVTENDAVSLDGSGSFGLTSAVTGFAWQQLSGTAVALGGASTASPSFTAPALDAGSDTLLFRLTVTAGNGLTDSIDVTVQYDDGAVTRVRAFMDSEPGDFIGMGGLYAYDENNSILTTTLQPFDNAIRIDVDGYVKWRHMFSIAEGAAWQPGTYADVHRYPFGNPYEPGASASAAARGCNKVAGWYEIVEVSIVEGQVQSLAMDYVHSCIVLDNPPDPPHFGAIRINSAVPLDRNVLYAVAGADVGTIEGQVVWLDGTQSYTRDANPLQYSWQQISGPPAHIVDPQAAFTGIDLPAGGGELEFQLTVSDGTGRTDVDTVRILVRGRNELQSYLLVDSPQGDYIGNGQLWLFTPDNGHFTVTTNDGSGPHVEVDNDAAWVLDLAAAAGPLAPGSYEGAERYVERGENPGVDWSGDGRGCSHISGRFDVLSIEYSGGDVVSAAIDFEQSCERMDPAALGQLRYNVVPGALPIAKAGADRAVIEGRLVQLDGTQSSDDVGLAGYEWTQIAGPTVTLSGAATATPSFTAPAGTQELAFRLKVSDGSGNLGFDSVAIHVGPDTDGDDVPDAVDAFPNDPTESVDSDGDGYGDNSDAYPNDPDEHVLQPDTDEDGIWDKNDTDDDNDGIPDTVEAGAPGGDGNGDGIADSLQAGVRTITDRTGAMVTLEVGAGVVVESFAALDNPNPGVVPGRVEFRRAFIAMTLNVDAGGAATVTLWLHGATSPDSYWKYDAAATSFYRFGYDGATGAQILPDRVVLHFVDGARGDSDATADGRIVDPGAPAWNQGGGSGGPMTAPALLALLALLGLRRRRIG